MDENQPIQQNSIPSQTPEINFSQTKQNRFPRLLIIGFLVIVLVSVVGIGGYFLGAKKNNTAYTETPVITKISSPTPIPDVTSQTSPSPIPTIDPTANWKTYVSSCGISVKYPREWNAQKYFIEDSTDSCAFLTAPDYKQGMDTRSGFSVAITRMVKGSINMKIIVNTIDDYIKSVEAVLQPSTPVTNEITKIYGSLTGTQFDFSAYESITTFIFVQGNYFYIVNWPTTAQYNGSYRTSIDQILSTLKFTP